MGCVCGKNKKQPATKTATTPKPKLSRPSDSSLPKTTPKSLKSERKDAQKILSSSTSPSKQPITTPSLKLEATEISIKDKSARPKDGSVLPAKSKTMNKDSKSTRDQIRTADIFDDFDEFGEISFPIGEDIMAEARVAERIYEVPNPRVARKSTNTEKAKTSKLTGKSQRQLPAKSKFVNKKIKSIRDQVTTADIFDCDKFEEISVASKLKIRPEKLTSCAETETSKSNQRSKQSNLSDLKEKSTSRTLASDKKKRKK